MGAVTALLHLRLSGEKQIQTQTPPSRPSSPFAALPLRPRLSLLQIRRGAARFLHLLYVVGGRRVLSVLQGC